MIDNKGEHLAKDSKGISKGKVDKYFSSAAKCSLGIYYYCSCANDQKANDIGEGKGGLFTNHFMAKGTFKGNDLQRGKEFKVTRFE